MRYMSAAILACIVLAGCKDDETVALDAEAVARGEEAFETCSACHGIENESNGVGPHLVEVIGRKAGAVDGYAYSDAMVNSGLVWTPAQMTTFLLDPAGTVPGTKMALGEITEGEVSDVVVYLQSLQQ